MQGCSFSGTPFSVAKGPYVFNVHLGLKAITRPFPSIRQLHAPIPDEELAGMHRRRIVVKQCNLGNIIRGGKKRAEMNIVRISAFSLIESRRLTRGVKRAPIAACRSGR